VLERLDRMPLGRAGLIGGASGLVLGEAAVLGGWPALIGVGLVGVTAGLVGWRGEAVPFWEEPFEDLLDMVEIPGGTFLMGSPEGEEGRDDDEIQHQVTVSPFLMSRTTVPRAEYRELLGLEDAPGPGGDRHPVTAVSWFDAVGFCNRLSDRAGLEPCYEFDGQEVRWVRDTGGYRLPTEAEWEYAARAGTTTRWSFGDDESKLGKYAWYGGNSGREAHEVAKLEPNPWGLYDIHGNVWEWCWDIFGPYDEDASTDPRGVEASSPDAVRVVRGGGFNDEPRFLRSAYRFSYRPGDRIVYLGFRCVRRSRPEP